MPITERLIHPMFAFIVAHPRIILSIFIICTSVMGWQARHFEIDASANTLLTKNNRHYIETEVVNQRFSPKEFLLIAYKPRDHGVFSAQTFADLKKLSSQLNQIDRVESVHSILNVPLLSLAGSEITADVDASQWTIEKHHFDMDKIRKAFSGNPIYEDLLINKGQTATAIQVLFKTDPRLEKLDREITELQQKTLHGKLSAVEHDRLATLREQAKTIEKDIDHIRTKEIRHIRVITAAYEDRADIYLGGVHVLGYQLIRLIKHDLIVFGGAIAVMICLILFMIFGKVKWVIISVICCTCSVISTMGLFGLLDFETTVISANFIALQLIFTLAIVIHLIVQYREYSAANPGWDQANLVKQTLFRKAGPCFYAGATTGVGFGSLIFSGIQPVITFGWMMIIAISISLVISLILFPAVMAMFPREQARVRRKFSRVILNFCARLVLLHPGIVIVTSVGLLVISVAGMLRLTVENSFINYFRDSTRVHRELVFIDQQFGGSTPLDLVYTIPVQAHHDDLVLTAATVQKMQRIQQALEQHKGVGKTLSLVNFTELAKHINNDQPLTEYELTALYWTMEKSLRNNLLGSFFSPEHRQVRFSARIVDTTPGLNRAQLMKNIHSDMGKLGIPRQSYTLTNLFVLYQDILQRLFHSQILTLGLVYIVLTLTFLAIFRSIRIALIAIAPNILPTLSVLGLMGWLNISLDLMTITIASIAMGIAVDDTIHYIHRYREELRDVSPNDAVTRSHSSVGFAMLYTSLIIILGFSLFAMSDFMPSVEFGLLTGFAMFIALLGDVCLLPVLLRKFVVKV